MSYCIYPKCPQPKNPSHTDICQACRSKLVLRDRYRVLHVLGQGRFGITFLAQDDSKPSHPNCVIKQLRPTTTESYIREMAQELFEREAKTLKQIGYHPQIPQVLDYCGDAQPPYFVEQYISGLTLKQEIKKSGPMSEAEVKQFLSEFLPLLDFIHSQQLIHRDIKPDNIIRRQPDGKLVLIDFGAVKNCQDAPEEVSEQTTWTNNSIGTQGFMPPEAIALRPVFASDIYALGVTCIYLLTGKSPQRLDYNRSTCEMVWQKYVQVSEPFTKILNKMLEASVRYRYQSAQEVLRSLHCILEPLTLLDAQILLEVYQKGERDFSFQNMSGVNLENANLSGGTFHQSLLIKTNLQQTNLSDTNFSQANLSHANLREANLGWAYFHDSNLSGADLRGANLSRAYFCNSNFTGADLRGADLSFAYFNNASLKRANLCGANLVNATITEQQLAQAKKNWATVLPSGKQGF